MRSGIFMCFLIKFIQNYTDIFIYTVYFSNYYNNYLKNRFLRSYEPMAETAGHVSSFFFR